MADHTTIGEETVLLPAILTIPAAILNGYSTVKTDKANITGVECQIADEYKHTPFPLIYNILLLSVAFAGALILIVVYSFIWRTTWRHFRFVNTPKPVACAQTSNYSDDCNIGHLNKTKEKKAKYVFTVSRNTPSLTGPGNMPSLSRPGNMPSLTRSGNCPTRHSSHENSMRKVTRIMFAVTLVFIISYIPNCTLQILNAAVHDFFNQLNYQEKIVYQLMLRSFMISYSANPLIYGFIDKTFRQACMNALRCERYKDRL